MKSFRDMLATGCEDKNVRVYYVPANTDMPLKVFSGGYTLVIQWVLYSSHTTSCSYLILQSLNWQMNEWINEQKINEWMKWAQN